MLLLNALETKRKKYLYKKIFQAAFVPASISIFVMNFSRS